ncbi:MAG: hypothetical protein ACE5GM_10785 [bacterium]
MKVEQQKICKAKSKQTGRQCKQAVVPGYEVCYHHGANGGPPKGNKNAMKHGAYVNELLDEHEKAIFQEFYQDLHRDFEFNESSDRRILEVACIYFVRLLRALKGGDNEDVYKVDLLLSKKLSELKVTKEKREGEIVNVRTSPAEWISKLLEEVRQEEEEEEKQKAEVETAETEKNSHICEKKSDASD